MARDTYVRIGEAARLAGVSVDTLRRWESAGKLTAARTPGGQRTYVLAEIERLRDIERPIASSARSSSAAQPAPDNAPVPPWKARQANAEADLAVTRSKIERNEEIRRYRDEQNGRAFARQAEAVAQAQAARLQAQREALRQEQQGEITDAVRRVRNAIVFEPAGVRADIERLIADHCQPGVSLPWFEAEVSAIRERHRGAEEAREVAERDSATKKAQEAIRKVGDSLRLNALIRHGESYAQSVTSDRSDWDSVEADEAVEDVRDHLSSVVQPNWSKRQVEREVDECLDAW